METILQPTLCIIPVQAPSTLHLQHYSCWLGVRETQTSSLSKVDKRSLCKLQELQSKLLENRRTKFVRMSYTCLPYTAVDCRRPSFSCRHCPHLERPAVPRHVHIISACFPKPPEDAPFPASFPVTFVQCLRSDSCHH